MRSCGACTADKIGVPAKLCGMATLCGAHKVEDGAATTCLNRSAELCEAAGEPKLSNGMSFVPAGIELGSRFTGKLGSGQTVAAIGPNETLEKKPASEKLSERNRSNSFFYKNSLLLTNEPGKRFLSLVGSWS